MKIDLCKLLRVKEGEEFKIEGYNLEYRYKVYNNRIQYFDEVLEQWNYSSLSVNALVTSELIKLPKKKQFSQDTLNFFKCIDKKFDWIAKDNNGEVCIYSNKPNKRRIYWSLDFVGVGCRAEIYGFDKSLFDQIVWEDEEPIRIDDYVERQA